MRTAGAVRSQENTNRDERLSRACGPAGKGASLIRKRQQVQFLPRLRRCSSVAERPAHNREVGGSVPPSATGAYPLWLITR